MYRQCRICLCGTCSCSSTQRCTALSMLRAWSRALLCTSLLCATTPASGPLCPLLTIAAHHAAPQGPASQLGIRIKWPNDIYYGSLKIGGILLHTSFQVRRLLLGCTCWHRECFAVPCAGGVLPCTWPCLCLRGISARDDLLLYMHCCWAMWQNLQARSMGCMYRMHSAPSTVVFVVRPSHHHAPELPPLAALASHLLTRRAASACSLASASTWPTRSPPHASTTSWCRSCRKLASRWGQPHATVALCA